MTTPVRDPALSPDEVREVLAGQRWTAHNIELAPDVWTLPGEPDFVETNLHLISMTRLLNLLFGDVRGLRVADLGCLEGGFALAFARAIGEYGSVVFISGNMPMKTEIVPLLIITKLEQYDYAGATAVALVMLVLSFTLLLVINLLQWAARRRMAV